MKVLAQIRVCLARRPWLYWLAVGLCTAAIAGLVTSMLGSVREQQQQWGTTQTVLVATTDIAAGQPLSALSRVQRPAAMVPIAAVQPDDVPSAATAWQAVGVGEIVTQADVAPGSGTAALLPADWVGITIDVPNVGLFAIGDAAVVFAFGEQVAPQAKVLAVSESQVSLGVPIADAGRVADAANQHLAVVALSTNPQPPPTG